MNLDEFLEARLFEDEVAAWAMVDAEVETLRRDGMPDITRADLLHMEESDAWRRPILECDAKRVLVDTLRSYEPSTEWGTEPDVGKRQNNAAGALRRLALVYKDHPDYQQEWTPYGRPSYVAPNAD